MISSDVLHAVATGSYHAPHDVLGLHTEGTGTVVRTLRPMAETVSITGDDGSTLTLEHLQDGIWQGTTPAQLHSYTVTATYSDGSAWTTEDAYRFSPTLTEFDLHLISEGRHERLWDALGAHPRTHDGVPGTSFSVWAPNAHAVRVAGSFNGWNGAEAAMRSLGRSGVWELFLPHVSAGARYKYEIRTASGDWILKADPLASAAEVPPATASVVASSSYVWADDAWISRRGSQSPAGQAMSIYEVHLGSWREGLDYRSAAAPLIEHVTSLGFTHVEFMPLAEHPFGGSWGYQVSGYYAPTSRFGTPDDLRYLIDQLHAADIGVIMDWVPGHFPKDAFALGQFDGVALYEHPDPRRGEHKDWGTYIFDYGRNEVRNFLVANALYWIEQFHVDGLRVDAVASMLYLDYSRNDGEWEANIYGGRENLEAIQFLQEVTATAHKLHPGVAMIAEESTSFPGVTAPTGNGGLGFDFKWNMGWMNDSLRYIGVDPLYRAHHNGEIAFSFHYAFSEKFILPISHDEVVHGKGTLLSRMPGDHHTKLAGLRGYLGYMWSHPGKQLLFMGQEFGQLSEWSEARALDWWMLDQPSHRALLGYVAALNNTYREHPALWQRDHDGAAFERLGDPDWNPNVIGFVRRGDNDERVVSLTNFSGAEIADMPIRLPAVGTWTEVLNSDATAFGGAGIGNWGAVEAGADGVAHVTLPALGSVWFTHPGH